MSNKLIDIIDITKSYDENVILDKLNLYIRENEFLTLLGPSGCLVVNEDTLETTRDNVYAGGDAVTGAATVILAMGAGKQAAASIHERLSK